MGGSFSAFNKFGLPGLSTATTKQVFERHFQNKPTGNFEDFHIAYVEFCKYFNTIMPGQDFDTPPLEQIKEFYNDKWVRANDDQERKELFFEFMKKVREATVEDSFFIVAGLAAPVAAVVGKRASGHIPYVKSLRLDMVPNVVFVPMVTLFGIMGATAWQVSSKSAKSAAAKEQEEAKEEEKQRKDQSSNKAA